MIDISLPLPGRRPRLVFDSGYCCLSLPLLGDMVFVIRLAPEAGRPRFAYHGSRGTGWRTFFLGRFQISHVFR